MKMESKRRFMRNRLGISTKNISSADINSFFRKINRIKKKYAKK